MKTKFATKLNINNLRELNDERECDDIRKIPFQSRFLLSFMSTS